MRTALATVVVLGVMGAAGGFPAAWAAPDAWTSPVPQAPRAPSAVVALPAPPPPTAQEVRIAATVAPAVVACCPDPWEFSLRLPIWVPGISGTLASGTSTVEGGRGNSLADRLFDATTELRFAFTGGFRVGKGRWEFAADAFYVSVGSEVGFTLNDQPVLDAGLDALVAQGGVGYRFGRWGLGRGGRGPCLDAFALLGLRYYSVGFWAETANLRVDRQADWADPLVGLRLECDLSRRFSVSLRGDVGGFGVGSDLSWSASALLHWHFAHRWQLVVGWNVLDVDYGFGSGDRRFVWDLHLSGPMLAIQYDF